MAAEGGLITLDDLKEYTIAERYVSATKNLAKVEDHSESFLPVCLRSCVCVGGSGSQLPNPWDIPWVPDYWVYALLCWWCTPCRNAQHS